MNDPSAIRDVTIDSQALARKMRVRVIVPPGFAPHRAARYPVLYFLHPWGLSPGYITDKLNIHRHLWQGVRAGTLPPMVIAIPTGFKSFFVNAADPPGHDWTHIVESNDRFFQDALDQYGRYGDYLLREVIPYVEQHYPVRTDCAGRAIGGISMGGAGAAVHAFCAPERFCAVGIHSPALFDGPPGHSGPPWIFGLTPETFVARSPAHLAQRLTLETQPRIFLDTSSRDVMRDQVAYLHRALEANGIAHTYSVPVGGHDKTYWEPRMPEYLAFYAQDWR